MACYSRVSVCRFAVLCIVVALSVAVHDVNGSYVNFYFSPGCESWSFSATLNYGPLSMYSADISSGLCITAGSTSSLVYCAYSQLTHNYTFFQVEYINTVNLTTSGIFGTCPLSVISNALPVVPTATVGYYPIGSTTGTGTGTSVPAYDSCIPMEITGSTGMQGYIIYAKFNCECASAAVNGPATCSNSSYQASSATPLPPSLSSIPAQSSSAQSNLAASSTASAPSPTAPTLLPSPSSSPSPSLLFSSSSLAKLASLSSSSAAHSVPSVTGTESSSGSQNWNGSSTTSTGEETTTGGGNGAAAGTVVSGFAVSILVASSLMLLLKGIW